MCGDIRTCDDICDGEIKLSPKNYIKIFILLALVFRFAYWTLFKSGSGSGSVASAATTRATPEHIVTALSPKIKTEENQGERGTQKLQTLKRFKTANRRPADRIPTKPLRRINREIVSRTHPVDLAFEKMTDLDHPHLGALDEDGKPGYVADQLSLRKSPPDFQMVSDDGNACERNHDGNHKMLTQRVSIDFTAHDAADAKAKASSKERAKIMCVVYTIEENHSRIPPIRQTWGQRCDGFIVVSDATDPIINTVHVPHEGDEEYGNIWQKVRSAWSYVYDNYYDHYDWFHIGGDDLYVLVENLRLYLESEEIQLAANGGKLLPDSSPTSQYPLFLGRRFKEGGNEDRIFNSGGSGYTINKAALKALVVDGFPKCMPHLKTFAEDVMVAQCLRNQVNVYPYDTKDEYGSERYMPFQPAHHLDYKIPTGPTNDWYVKYSIDIKEGYDHCAPHSVAFHYIKPKLMRRMHAILYGLCPQ